MHFSLSVKIQMKTEMKLILMMGGYIAYKCIRQILKLFQALMK